MLWATFEVNCIINLLMPNRKQNQLFSDLQYHLVKYHFPYNVTKPKPPTVLSKFNFALNNFFGTHCNKFFVDVNFYWTTVSRS